MASRVRCVQVRRAADVPTLLLLAVIVGDGLIARLAADDAKVHEKRQLENEWASTSKKDHKGPNTYEFRYDVENAPTNNVQYRMEERHANGSVVGSYGQVQPDGKIRVVSYVADKDGVKAYVKDNGGQDKYVAEGSSLDPVQRVTSQIIQTGAQSQQHRSPLHDKYHRPSPVSATGAANNRVDTAHAYHQQRTNVDPASFRPVDEPGYQETEQPFVGDQLKDKLHSSLVEYQVTPPHQQQQQFVQAAAPLPPVVPYNLQQRPVSPLQVQAPVPQQQAHPSHYLLNVPPLPALADNSPLPLLPGQQPLPITPDRGPIMIQLQQPQQQQINQQQPYPQYPPPPSHVYHPQGQQPVQQQFIHPTSAQQYQQQPVRVTPPVQLLQPQQHHQQIRLAAQQQQAKLAPQNQQHVQYQPQQARVVTHQKLPPQQQQQQQLQQQQQQQQQLQQIQQQQQKQQQQLQQQKQQQLQLQKAPYQQSVMQQPYTQQVNIPAQPSQMQLKGIVQQQHAVAPMQYFHQPNPATTMEQYRQQLQLQAAETQIYPVFMLPPSNFNVYGFKAKRFGY